MHHRFSKHSSRTAILFFLSYLIVMIIPLATSMGFFYPRLRTTLINKATEQAASSIFQVKDETDAQLFNVLTMPTYIFQNKRIILKNLLDNPLARLQAKEDMEQMIKTNTFISHLFLYLRDLDYFIVPRSGTFYFEDIGRFPGLYETSFGGWSKDELYDIIENTNTLTVQPINSMTIAGIKYAKTILFIMPFPSKSFARASLMVAVPANNLDEMVDNIDQKNVLFFLSDGQLVHSTSTISRADSTELFDQISASGSMNGTEQFVLTGNESNIVAWSRSERYNWLYVQITPMSLIIGEINTLTNNTLLLAGFVTFFCLFMIYLAMKVNYSPIKRLARLAEKTSPGNITVKNDFDTIQQLITRLTSENIQLEKRLDDAEPKMREYFISRIISGSMEETQQALRNAENMNINIVGQSFTAIIVVYDNAADAAKVLQGIQACDFGDQENLITLYQDLPEQVVILLADISLDIMLQAHEALFSGYSYLVAGQTVSSPEDIGCSYSSAYAALDYIRLKGENGKIQRYEDLPERVFNPRSYPLEVMQALETSILHANCERLKELMAQIEAQLNVDGAPPYYTRSIYFNAINLLISGLMRYLGESNDTVRQIGMRSMLNHHTINEMVNILHRTSARLIQIIEKNVQKFSPMANALNYIDVNISSPGLCLQTAADSIGMSPSAFSRAFKERIGKNFKEYVDLMRIGKAKTLLKETDMLVEQIAASVGYDTITSFYRMFKNYTGSAPGEYREFIQKQQG